MRGFLFGVTLALVGCGGEGDRAQAILDLTGDPAAGEAVYAANCESCHGPGGLGVDEPEGSYTGDNLTEAAGEAGEDAEIVDYILNGEGSMTAFADVLEDQEIADVLAYLHDGLIQ